MSVERKNQKILILSESVSVDAQRSTLVAELIYTLIVIHTFDIISVDAQRSPSLSLTLTLSA